MAKRLAQRPLGTIIKLRPTMRTLRLADGRSIRIRLHKLPGRGHIYAEVEGLRIEGFGDVKDLTGGSEKV